MSEMYKELEKYWKDRPYLRLGQIVVNAFRTLSEYKKNPEPEISDIFYIPDSKLIEGLRNLENLESESKNKRTT